MSQVFTGHSVLRARGMVIPVLEAIRRTRCKKWREVWERLSHLVLLSFRADMGKLRPAGQIWPAGSFTLAHRHLQKLKTFFLVFARFWGVNWTLRDVKTFFWFWGVHWTSKDVKTFFFWSSPMFSVETETGNSVRPAASANLVFRVKSLPTPDLERLAG